VIDIALTTEFAISAGVRDDRGANRIIRWSTTGAEVGVAAIAAVASYEHACALVRSASGDRRRKVSRSVWIEPLR
jgi:hypothetical protein